MDCMDKFYSKSLGCILPWIPKMINQTYQNMSICTGKAKFEAFQNFSKKILSPEMKKELVNAGCLIPNCKQRSWGKPLRYSCSNVMTDVDLIMGQVKSNRFLHKNEHFQRIVRQLGIIPSKPAFNFF